MTQINVRDVPQDTHTAFKTLCAANRTTMRAALMGWIEQSIQQGRIDLGAKPKRKK